ncbi:23 kDa integral membrane protein-like [Chironomus tepperi]|uniref:23 kDa integral membrane protein-like n=1 Tax=Chironomus tepperi TaxID=113505 RepID=UPI00391F7172
MQFSEVTKGVIKYLLFFFNFLFLISGLGILIAGIVVLHDVTDFNHFLDDRITAPPIILIVAGLLIFLIAFFGCYGALKESPKLLYTFAFLLAIIFIIEIAVGIAAITFRNDLEGILNTQLRQSMIRQNKDDMMAWDTVQKKLQCCGIDGPRNWFEKNETKEAVPASCCRPQYIDRETQNCLNAAPLYMDRVYTVCNSMIYANDAFMNRKYFY